MTERQINFIRGGKVAVLLAGLCVILSLPALAAPEEVIQNGSFDSDALGSPIIESWHGQGLVVDFGEGHWVKVGGTGSSGELYQDFAASPATLPGQAITLHFKYYFSDPGPNASLRIEIVGLLSCEIVNSATSGPYDFDAPVPYSFNQGTTVDRTKRITFTATGLAGTTIAVDDISLRVEPFTIPDTPTHTPTETPTPTGPTPTETPTGTPPTETPTPTATGPTPTPSGPTPTPPPTSTPTPGKAARLKVSANPDTLQGKRSDIEEGKYRSIIRMSVVDVSGTILTNVSAGDFTATRIEGPGEAGEPRANPDEPGVFESIYYADGEGRALIEVRYTKEAEPLVATIAITVDAIEVTSGTNIGPPPKSVLYQRAK